MICIAATICSVAPRSATASTTSPLGSLVLLARHCLACCFCHFFGVPAERNERVNGINRQNAWEFNQPRANENQLSISVIPSTISSQRKMLVIGAQPSLRHMSKRAICLSCFTFTAANLLYI